MAFDQTTRNRLQKFVADARSLLADEFTRQLQATYGMNPKTGEVANTHTLSGLTPNQQETAHLLRDTLAHYLANAEKGKEKARNIAAIERIVREQAFTVLNRLAALRMSEARGFLIESLAKGYDSKGFQLFHRVAGNSLGETGDAYRHYLFSLFDEFSLDLSVLFDRFSVQGRLFPNSPILLKLLGLINDESIAPLWAEDETIGWIYQYFNNQEERKKMREQSQAPRNSRELAVRNQFFTPRYVVEFLTDNTLGRIWYEMSQGKTGLTQSCKYLVRRPNERFLAPDEIAPEPEENLELSQEELLQQTVYIQHRALKDPRDIRMLDPACGSMHFGLYAFDLFEAIYSEAWDIEATQGIAVFTREHDKTPITSDYKNKAEFLADVPRLIIENNIHGVDIDPRAIQIAGLSLWLRAHNSWQKAGIKPQNRPKIQRSNIVCAEPMPGEKALLQEFTASLKPTVLGQLVEVIFEKMELAGEAGTLLKIEKEIQDAIAEAKASWQQQNQALSLFPDLAKIAKQRGEIEFDVSDINDEGFWEQAEQKILTALADYAQQATTDESGQRRLFADDAAKGFAFIELCRKRFDVVLMNPPFGESTGQTKNVIKINYKNSFQDILQCFVERSFELLTKSGVQGVLSARTGFFFGDSENWRKSVLLVQTIDCLCDLGLNVLDDALVEVSAYTLRKFYSESSHVFATRHLSTKEKEQSLLESITNANMGEGGYFNFPQKLLDIIPTHTLAYWAPPSFICKYINFPSFGQEVARVRQGMATADDFRFVRLVWEIPKKYLGQNARWVPFSKGGEYSPFFDDIHLAVDWGLNGAQLKSYVCKQYPYLKGNWSFVIKNIETYFKEGATYTVRTASAFTPKFLPKGSIYSHNTQTWQLDSHKKLISSMGFFSSRTIQSFVDLATGGGDVSTSGSAARRYTTSIIEGVPSLNKDELENDWLYSNSLILLEFNVKQFNYDETSVLFTIPFCSRLDSLSKDSISGLLINEQKSKINMLPISKKIDDYVISKMKITDKELEYVSTEVGEHPFTYKKNDEKGKEAAKWLVKSDKEIIDHAISINGAERWFTKKTYFVDRKIEILSHLYQVSPYSVVEYYNSNADKPGQKFIFESVLSEIFGMLLGRWSFDFIRSGADFNMNNFIFGDGLSAINKLGNSYDLNGGIIFLDVSSVSSFENEIFSLLKRIWNNDEFDFNFSLFLPCKRIFYYFSDPKFFFSKHLSQYSKSRRNAPIYWLLQTHSGTYSIWLYYHRLNEQTLFICVNNFVEPKLVLVNEDLFSLRNKSSRSIGEENEFARLSDLKIELEDFRDELLRLAKFWKPNLNDGVQITAAPLWRLFQHKAWQKKLKETWEKLEEGDYDWAHLAYSIWPARVLRKCHQDRSLAITHGVEDELWHEVEVIKGRNKNPAWEWQPKPLSDTELNAYIQAKIQAMGHVE